MIKHDIDILNCLKSDYDTLLASFLKEAIKPRSFPENFTKNFIVKTLNIHKELLTYLADPKFLSRLHGAGGYDDIIKQILEFRSFFGTMTIGLTERILKKNGIDNNIHDDDEIKKIALTIFGEIPNGDINTEQNNNPAKTHAEKKRALGELDKLKNALQEAGKINIENAFEHLYQLEDQRYWVAQYLLRQNSGFLVGLGIALTHSDSYNISRIKNTWQDIWDKALSATEERRNNNNYY